MSNSGQGKKMKMPKKEKEKGKGKGAMVSASNSAGGDLKVLTSKLVSTVSNLLLTDNISIKHGYVMGELSDFVGKARPKNTIEMRAAITQTLDVGASGGGERLSELVGLG